MSTIVITSSLSVSFNTFPDPLMEKPYVSNNYFALHTVPAVGKC